MAKERSYTISLLLLLLSLLLCFSSQSQVGVAEAKRHTLATRYSDSRCANKILKIPKPENQRITPHSKSPKGKGP
ncbi:unnamed protein product [Brassica rapa subsp. trilocularis]